MTLTPRASWARRSSAISAARSRSRHSSTVLYREGSPQRGICATTRNNKTIKHCKGTSHVSSLTASFANTPRRARGTKRLRPLGSLGVGSAGGAEIDVKTSVGWAKME